MDDIKRKVQELLNADYRALHPELESYSDEEIALMNPVTYDDITAYIAYENDRIAKEIEKIDIAILDFGEEITLSKNLRDDPKTFSMARTEANSDIIYAERKIMELTSKKKQLLDPNDDFKEYTVELLKKLDYKKEDDYLLFNKLGFSFIWDSLNRKAKRDILNKLVSQIEITRDKNYNIEIKNIKFTDEFISRSCKEYLEYLNDILKNNNIGIKYQELITTDELNDYSKNYYVLSLQKLEKNEYSNDERKILLTLASEHFYYDGIIQCPLYSNETIIDQIMLIPKTEIC